MNTSINRRGFLLGIGAGIALAVTPAFGNQRCRNRFRKRRCCTHCCCSNSSGRVVDTVNILIGGRGSTLVREEVALGDGNLFEWHTPNHPNNFYWYVHNLWASAGCYGRGIGKIAPVECQPNQKDHFSWSPGSLNPSKEDIEQAAHQVGCVCRWLRDQHGLQKFQLFGHSAGARVANTATHLITDYLGSDFQFDNLILLSPPVPKEEGGTIPIDDCGSTCFPDVERIKRNLFFNFYVRTDPVLNGWFDVNKHYCYPYIEQRLPDVYASARQKELPLRGHWQSCRKSAWNDYQLADFISSANHGSCTQPLRETAGSTEAK